MFLWELFVFQACFQNAHMLYSGHHLKVLVGFSTAQLNEPQVEVYITMQFKQQYVTRQNRMMVLGIYFKLLKWKSNLDEVNKIVVDLSSFW